MSSIVKKQENNYKLASITTVAVFCMGQIPGSIDAAISKISIAFGLTSTSGMYVTTVSCIVSVVFSIILGFVAGKKIGYKPLIIFCSIVELVSALVPFITNSFIGLIVLRGLFGIGFGGMQSIENTVATVLIPKEKRASILGMGMFFGFGMNCILQFIGGFLADIGWNYVFLNHILLIIPFIIVIIGCSKLDFKYKDTEQTEQKVPDDDTEQKISKGLSGGAVLMWIVMLFVGIFIAPLLVGCSFLSEEINPSASVAGVVAVFFSVGCMVGGLILDKLYKIFKSFMLTFTLIITALGIAGCGIARSIVLLCIFIFIAGMGFALTQSTAMMALGFTTHPKKIALVSAIMMALYNLGMFLSSSYEDIVGSITGDALYIPLYIGAVVLVVISLICIPLSPLKTVKQSVKIKND